MKACLIFSLLLSISTVYASEDNLKSGQLITFKTYGAVQIQANAMRSFSCHTKFIIEMKESSPNPRSLPIYQDIPFVVQGPEVKYQDVPSSYETIGRNQNGGILQRVSTLSRVYHKQVKLIPVDSNSDIDHVLIFLDETSSGSSTKQEIINYFANLRSEYPTEYERYCGGLEVY